MRYYVISYTFWISGSFLDSKLIDSLDHLILLARFTLFCAQTVWQIIGKLPRIPVVDPPQPAETVLDALFPLPQINFLNFVLLKESCTRKPLVQKFEYVFDRMKADHLIPLEADALPTWLRLLKESLIVVIVDGVNPIPVVKSISKLPSVDRGPSPTVIFIVSEISLIDDAALGGILHAEAVLSGSAHLPLVYHVTIEENDAVSVDGIPRDALRFDKVLSDANFLHRLHQLRRERDRMVLVFWDGVLLSPRGVHTDEIVQHQKQCEIIINRYNNSWILPYPRQRQYWSSSYIPEMLETIRLQQIDQMGSLSSTFKGDKQWTEPQINTKADQVFTKYDLTGHGLDRVDFGRWLQSEAQDIGKTYNEKQLDDAYNEVHHDQNGRIQRQQLAEYLRKVHNVT